MAGDSNYWEGVFWRRMSRRGFIKAAAISGVAIGVGGALGCQTSEQPAASKTPAASQPKRGGVYVFPNASQPVDLDIHSAAACHTGMAGTYVYNSLIRYNRIWDEKGSLTPEKFEMELAESWEQPDPTTYVFKLRKGFKFQNLPPVNGRDVTAEDVKYSIERIKTPKPEFTRASFFDPVESITAVDSSTARFKLKEPSASFILNMGDGWTAIVPREVVERDGDLKRTAIGSGAFILDKWTTGVSLEFKRNPDYFFADQIYLDGVKYAIIKDKGMTMASFRAGDLDRLGGLTKADLNQVKQGVSDLDVWPNHGGRTWVFINNKRAPFDDPNVRRACAHATNCQDFIDMLWDGDAVRTGPIPFFQPPWSLSDSELPKFDLTLAKEYMAKSKYPNGVKVVSDVGINLGNSKEIMEIIQRQWKQIGVEVELNPMDYMTQFVPKLFRRDYALTASGDDIYLDPTDYLYYYFHTKGSRNWTNYDNPEFNRLAEEQRGELNQTKRADIVKKLQKMLIDDAAGVFLAVSKSYTVSRQYVKGLKPWFVSPGCGGTSGGTFQMKDVWIDK